MSACKSLTSGEASSDRLALPGIVSYEAGKEIEAIYQSSIVDTLVILASLQKEGRLFELNSRYYRNCSPLASAAYEGNLEKVICLVEAGAKDYLLRPDHYLCEGASALYAAASSAQVDTVRYLLSQGAKFDKKMRDSGHGFFQFPHLIESYCQRRPLSSNEEQEDLCQRQCASLRLILGSTQNIQSLHGQLSSAGQPCLKLALHAGRRDLVELLLEFGFTWAEFEEESVRQNVFSRAISSGYLSLVQWFVEAQKVDIKGQPELPSLHHAKANRQEDVVQYLLEQGADPLFLNDQGEDYLAYGERLLSLKALRGIAHHFRSMAGFEDFVDFNECISFLKPEDVNREVDRKGNTLLHLLAQWPSHEGFYETFLPPLLQMGADLTLKNGEGKNPFVIGYDAITGVYASRDQEEMLSRLRLLLPW